MSGECFENGCLGANRTAGAIRQVTRRLDTQPCQIEAYDGWLDTQKEVHKARSLVPVGFGPAGAQRAEPAGRAGAPVLRIYPEATFFYTGFNALETFHVTRA